MKTVLLDLPMPITTSRILLRPPQSGDGVVLNAAVLESFDNASGRFSWKPHSR